MCGSTVIKLFNNLTLCDSERPLSLKLRPASMLNMDVYRGLISGLKKPLVILKIKYPIYQAL